MADLSARTESPAADGRQTQFLSVITRDEATARFRRHLTLAPLGDESVSLAEALDRVLAVDVVASVDVPGFDRSNVDGFAVQASDTFGAGEEDRRGLELNAEVLTPGMVASSQRCPAARSTVSSHPASIVSSPLARHHSERGEPTRRT